MCIEMECCVLSSPKQIFHFNVDRISLFFIPRNKKLAVLGSAQVENRLYLDLAWGHVLVAKFLHIIRNPTPNIIVCLFSQGLILSKRSFCYGSDKAQWCIRKCLSMLNLCCLKIAFQNA